MGKKPKPRTATPIAPTDTGGWKGRVYGFAEKFERVVTAAAAPLPSNRIKLWLAGFFHPEETYGKVEKHATLAGLAVNLLIFYFAYSLIFFLFMLALTSGFSAADLLSMGLQKNPDVMKIALGSLVASPFVSIIFALVAFASVFIPARVLGGNGTYAKQSYSMALVLCGSNLILLVLMGFAFAISLPSFILKDSPQLGTAVSIVALLANVPVLLLCLAIVLYTVYAHYLVVKKSHGLSAWRAAGAIAIAAVLIVILDIAVNAVLA